MKYWEEMASKWGFGDGDATPIGAELYRKVYITVLNKLLEKQQSQVRVTAYNRSGLHNSVLWLEVPARVFAQLDPDHVLNGELTVDELALIPDSERMGDDGWTEALEAAQGLNLDDLLEVVITINEAGLQEVLASI